MHKIFRISILFFITLIFSFYIPKGYKMAFEKNTGKTYLLYSPVIKKFVYREMTGEGHSFITRDEDGNDLKRQEYESLLPFIYYKNMELWKTLPIEIDGKLYDKDFIKNNKQVFQIKPSMINDNRPRVDFYPLLESQPDVARLIFPEDSFVFTDKEMKFINSDSNEVDEKLTKLFTDALINEGFSFPGKRVFGQVSILKPFDEGYFVVDGDEELFHIKKIKSRAFVKNTGVKVDSGIRYIKMNENRKKKYYGFLVSNSGKIFFLTYDNYSLIELPAKNYDPDKMDLKVILTPAHNTLVYSDDKYVYGVAMDTDFNPVKKYERLMYSARKKLSDDVFAVLFPFYIDIDEKNSEYLKFIFSKTDYCGLLGTLISFLILGFLSLKKKNYKIDFIEIILILTTGLYGLGAVFFNGIDE